MKKGVNWIENWDESLYKMEKIDAKSLKLVSLKLNVIDTNWFFCKKKGLHHTRGTNSDWQSQKLGSSLQNLPTMPKYGSTPPPPWNVLVFLKKGCIILWYNSWPHFLRYSWVNTDIQTQTLQGIVSIE